MICSWPMAEIAFSNFVFKRVRKQGFCYVSCSWIRVCDLQRGNGFLNLLRDFFKAEFFCLIVGNFALFHRSKNQKTQNSHCGEHALVKLS